MEKEKRNYGLIMAGGQGTRFWPWSSEEKPKQFLSIIGKESLITQTYNRLKDFLKEENIFIVADKKYLKAVKEALPGFNEANYIAEPSPRNTAPCLMLANIVLSQIQGDARLIAAPADHYIPERDIFADQFTAALEMAEEKCIITCGIKPTLPHTGYGYIEFDDCKSYPRGDTQFFNVLGFKEKPKIDDAEKYLAAGNYYWNSGMFVYKLSYFKELLKEYSPYYFGEYLELENTLNDREALAARFNAIKPQSIDYALMEKVKEVKMFKARFSWNDVGAWSSVYELNEKDRQNNVAAGRNNIFIDSTGSLIFSTEEKPIAVIGLHNVIVIDTEHGILVANIEETQKVKDVIAELKKTRGAGRGSPTL